MILREQTQMTIQKPNSGLFVETYNSAIGDAYYRSIKSLIRQYYKAVSDAAVDEFVRTGDFAVLTAEELLYRSGFDLRQYEAQIEQAATKFIVTLDMQANAKMRKAYVEAKKPLPEQLVRPTYINKSTKSLISQQVQLITGLEEFQYNKINNALQKTIVEKRSLSYFKEQLRSPELQLFNEKRIQTIAFNQLHYATNQVNVQKATSLGLDDATWNHPPKSVYKTEGRPSHIAADGKHFKLSKGCKIDGERIWPGQKPNCFLSTTKIQFADTIKGAFRRWDTHKLTSIITKSGNVSESTSNHPILTQRGFIGANAVNIGDYTIKVVSIKSHSSNQDSNDRISQAINFKDAFNILATQSGSHSSIIRNADFHGEKVINKNIDIIRTDSSLQFNIQHGKFISNGIKYFQFTTAKNISMSFRPFHAFYSTFNKFIMTIFSTTQKTIGRLSNGFSLIRAKMLHALTRRFALITQSDTILKQEVINCTATQSNLFRNIQNGNAIKIILDNRIWNITQFTTDNFENTSFFEICSNSCITAIIAFCNSFTNSTIIIELDKIVNINSREFTGHVYNLETNNNIYVANNILTHNCKCYYTINI